MYRLLNAVNINNYIIEGTGNNIKHSWNIVKIRGNYYHLDATFDDPVRLIVILAIGLLLFQFYWLLEVKYG